MGALWGRYGDITGPWWGRPSSLFPVLVPMVTVPPGVPPPPCHPIPIAVPTATVPPLPVTHPYDLSLSPIHVPMVTVSPVPVTPSLSLWSQ